MEVISDRFVMPGRSGCVLVFVVCLCFSFNQTTCQLLPLSRLESNMHTFAGNLAAFFRKTTALDGVKKDFMNANWTKVRKTDAPTRLNEVKQKLNAVINNKKMALEKLVKAAEKAHKQHTNTGDPQPSYPNAKNLSLKEFKLISDEKLGGTRVNLDMSSVHVPTDVYDQAPSILNAISWSSHLDATFKQNNDSSLTWQFFCSEDAHLRIYPGVQWRPPSEDAVLPSDVYDCRVQEWYIQASSSPKDVLVVLDVSGSMKGLNIEIAKTAVVKMLQTFTHDDFFNVLLYSDQVEFLEPCFQGRMVQATEVNKERIKTNLDLIKPRNIANLESALTVAFELLLSIDSEGRKHGASSNCNKMIMLMTDGGVQSCFEVFERFNATQNQIRIFTYLIGREVGESEFIKSLACLYSGSYYRISGFADVHEHIQRYLHVLSHQLSLGRSDRLAWSNTYYDVIEPGLGLVMTMAAPVYNSSSLTAALLGVVGTDFPLKEFINILNSCKIPVNGYWFMTNNGFTVTHPNLLAQPDVLTRRTLYALDINRMEVLDKNGKLKKYMFKGPEGSVVMDTLTTLTWEKVAIFSKNVFHFSTLENTPLRLGLSLPVGYRQFHSLNLSDLLTSTSAYEDLQNLRNTNFTIARWNYCNKKDEILLDFLIDNRNNLPAIREICDEKLLQLLLNDVTITKMTSDKWNKVLVRASQRRMEDVEFVFVATQGGLSRYFHVNPTSDLLNEMKRQSSTTDQLFYKLSAHHGASIITFTVPSLENSSTNPVIVVSKPITDTSEKSVFAVLGVALKQSLIEELLFRALKGCSDDDDDGDSRDNDGGQNNDDNDNSKCDFCDNFCSYENVSCFLIDVYGYVVYSEMQKNIGSFLGDVDQMNGLMQLLTIDHHDDQEGSDQTLFNRYTIVDLQSTCPISDEQTSSAVIQFSKPLEIVLSSMKYFIGNFVTFSMEIFLLVESLVYLLISHLIAPSISQSCKNRQLSATTASSPLTFYEDEMTSFSYSSSTADESSELSVLDEYLMRQGFEIEDPDLRSMMMECYGKYATQLDFQGKTTPIKNCFKEAKATWQKMNNRGNTTCFKHLMYYIANTSRLPLHGSLLTCDGECEKFYTAHLVPGSNLIFLAVESSCECEEDGKAFMKYSQIKYEDNSTYFCQLLKQEQQRDRFSKCITPNKEEFKKCSSAHRFLSSHAVLLTLLLVLPLFIF